MLFEITRRADYAARMMLELGEQAEGEWMPAERIVRNTSVPKAFLHKITADLVRAGLAKTHPGPAGGLALARPAHTINMLQIIEAIEGPVCVNICQLRPRACPRDLICPAHTMWGRLQGMIIQQLQGAVLDQLVEEAIYLKKNPRKHDAQNNLKSSQRKISQWTSKI